MLIVTPRSTSSGARSIRSNAVNRVVDPSRSASTLVIAAVRVVLPWSTWPMVPTLTCGLERTNCCLVIGVLEVRWPPRTARLRLAEANAGGASHTRAQNRADAPGAWRSDPPPVALATGGGSASRAGQPCGHGRHRARQVDACGPPGGSGHAHAPTVPPAAGQQAVWEMVTGSTPAGSRTWRRSTTW